MIPALLITPESHAHAASAVPYSDKRMKPLTMTMTITGLVVVSCLVLGCATDLPVVKDPTSAAEALLSRVKRKAVNTCQLTRHSVEEISYLTKDSLDSISVDVKDAVLICVVVNDAVLRREPGVNICRTRRHSFPIDRLSKMKE